MAVDPHRAGGRVGGRLSTAATISDAVTNGLPINANSLTVGDNSFTVSTNGLTVDANSPTAITNTQGGI